MVIAHLGECYQTTTPNRWFCSEEEARAARFRKAFNCSRVLRSLGIVHRRFIQVAAPAYRELVLRHQPISLGGQTGLNLAIGVAALPLGLPRQ
jgi:hypothetical protein